MATPMTADQFLAALKAEGVAVSQPDGWRQHNRAGHGAWGPVNGVMIHHTAGTGPSDPTTVWTGDAALPGPRAHGYLPKSGTVVMTANGRANHAGGGSPAVLAAVMDESYDAAPPATHFHEGSPGAADGNIHFYGLEISNRGDKEDPYPAVQYAAAVRWAAAICRHHGWSEKSVIAHREWSDQKPDPSFDIKKFRADVKARLAKQPEGAHGPANSAKPPVKHPAKPPVKPPVTSAPPKPAHQPFPGAEWFVTGRKSPIVAAMHDRLVAEGCGKYQSSANKDVIGSGDQASYEAWQHHLGFTGIAAKWPPGKTSWDKLKVPKVAGGSRSPSVPKVA